MRFFKSKIKFFRFIVITLTTCFIISSLIFFNEGGVFAQNTTIDTGLDATAGAAGLPTNPDIIVIVGQIVQVLLGLLGVVFVILLIYGGFIRLTAQGNADQIKKSTGIITSAVIGVIIILTAFIISTFIISRVGESVDEYSNGGCSVGGLCDCPDPNFPVGTYSNDCQCICPNSSTSD